MGFFFQGNNNINLIQAPNFSNFGDLEILDLSSNHISNWYERVFTKSDRLKIINLRENNINLMTPEMMKDFASIRFLAIGSNSFVCDCSLRGECTKFLNINFQVSINLLLHLRLH